jgi:xylitol oxidase
MTTITPAERNWAGNHVYAGRVVRPRSVEELQHVVAASRRVGFLGSRHSFNAIADSDVLIDMRALPQVIEVDAQRRRATVSGASTYGDLAPVLEAHGLALANLASLPHITVAGAIATGTHGSGLGNGALATAVTGLEIVRGDGELVRISRDDPDFDGCVVHLGALGAVAGVTLALEPTYEVRQWVVEDLPWPSVLGELETVMRAAYSVSLFTRWDGTVAQAWFKQRGDAEGGVPPAVLALGTPAPADRHPVGDLDPVNCTPQLGRPGPWFDRLPHFRLGFTPSSGDELQSEFLVDWVRGAEAIAAVERIGDLVRPALQVSEVRAVAGDRLWMSPSYGSDALAIHFTWSPAPGPVAAALQHVERVLLPLGARPHWGKVFAADAPALAGRYPRLADFAALADRHDPEHALRNEWLERHVFGPSTTGGDHR